MSTISLTDEAKRYLISMLENKHASSVRLDLAPQGCNGFKYSWEISERVQADHAIELENGKALIFQEDVAPMIKGSTVVLESNGMLGKKLALINPNAIGNCGCGESVNFN